MSNDNIQSRPESLDDLRANLQKALDLLTAAVDQSLKLSVDETIKRSIAKEWETTANGLISYVKDQARKDSQNLMAWVSMIQLKL